MNEPIYHELHAHLARAGFAEAAATLHQRWYDHGPAAMERIVAIWRQRPIR